MPRMCQPTFFHAFPSFSFPHSLPFHTPFLPVPILAPLSHTGESRSPATRHALLPHSSSGTPHSHLGASLCFSNCPPSITFFPFPQANLEALPPGTPSYLTAAVGPPTATSLRCFCILSNLSISLPGSTLPVPPSLQANLEALPPGTPSYLTAAVGPPTATLVRHFCSACGSHPPYTCPRCASHADPFQAPCFFSSIPCAPYPQASLEALPPGTPSYLTAAVGPPTATSVRRFCSTCGSHAPYTCPRCAARFCCISCQRLHNETRCLKFVM
ncbi:unnamed protein product [Closterium sp. NIES-54]